MDMNQKWIFSCLLLLFFNTVSHSANEYAVGKLLKGESAESFLKRYLLSPHDCNLDEFRKINKLKSKSKLIGGKLYKLPLKIVVFDGKTIRSSIGIQDYQHALKVEKFNNDLLKGGIRTHTFKENKKLWYPYTEFDCKDNHMDSKEEIKIETPKVEKLTNSSKTEFKRKGVATINIPLMGKEYEEIHIEDYSLKGQVYYVIAGHGGPDPGAVTSSNGNQMCEDEYAYDVALRLGRDLMQHGATVHMIVQDKNDGIRDEAYLECDGDEEELGKYSIPVSQKQRLRDRATRVNQLYKKYKAKGVTVQKSIEIHVDSRGANTRQDAFFYYNEKDAESKKLAQNIQDVFESKYAMHQKNRGYQGYVEPRNIYMVRSLLPTNVFVELANIRNSSDQQRLLINSNRQALANWLFEGLRK
jgi:N-acetylmuramoyl-L-alanine amidase